VDGARRKVHGTGKTQRNENLEATTKARKLENTKKGKGIHELLFFRAFVLSCFRDGFLGFHSAF
jgi:hypothetical protein